MLDDVWDIGLHLTGHANGLTLTQCNADQYEIDACMQASRSLHAKPCPVPVNALNSQAAHDLDAVAL